MQRKFVTNLAFLLLLNAVIKPFYFLGIDRKVQVLVGSEQYGLYFSLFSLSLLINIFLDMGITNFNNKDIAQHHNMLDKYFSNLVGFKILLGFVYFFLGLFIGFLAGYSALQLKFLFILLINQFLASFILYLRSNINGLHLFKTDSIFSVLDKFLMILFCSLLIWANPFHKPFQIMWFVYAQSLSYIITFFIAFYIVYTKSANFVPRFNFKINSVLLRNSMPFAILVLLMACPRYFDSIFLERLLKGAYGKYQAGLYAQSFRIVDVLIQFAFLFSVLLLPIFSRMLKKKEPVAQLTQLSFSLLMVPVFTIAIPIIFYRSDIISLMYHADLDHSSTVLGFLMLSFVTYSASFIFGSLLTANGNLKELIFIAGISVLISFGINIALTPKYYAVGSSISNFAAHTVAIILQIIVAKKIFNFKINYSLLLQYSGFLLILISTGFFLKHISLGWYFGFGIIITIGLILAFISGMISLKSLFKLVSEREGPES